MAGERDRWRAAWELYSAHVVRRLRSGQEQYKDTAPNRPPLELVREVQEELADIAGWSVWLYDKMEQVKQKLQAACLEPVLADRRSDDAPAKPKRRQRRRAKEE